MANIEIRQGDLLAQSDVDVVVNAWNRNFIPWWLLLPGGVSGAIRRRAGTAPFRELGRFGTLRSGDAVITGAGRLPYRAIIHVAALSAFWSCSEAIVRRCTVSALKLAAERSFESIAFPLIGSGVGGVPEEVALAAMQQEVRAHPFSGRVVIVRYAADGVKSARHDRKAPHDLNRA
jgi:O-acetyl-ADP-ribose deacetylase (regulator of RNase III)